MGVGLFFLGYLLMMVLTAVLLSLWLGQNMCHGVPGTDEYAISGILSSVWPVVLPVVLVIILTSGLAGAIAKRRGEASMKAARDAFNRR